MKREPTYVGIDVAKDRVANIAVRPTGQSWSASYEEEEVEKLVARLQGLEPAGVILEATGGLELTLVAALAAASLPVAVVNPRQVRDFCQVPTVLIDVAIDRQSLFRRPASWPTS